MNQDELLTQLKIMNVQLEKMRYHLIFYTVIYIVAILIALFLIPS